MKCGQFRNLKIDWLILIPLALLLVYGLLSVYSASHSSQGSEPGYILGRQLLWVIIGLIVFSLISVLPTRFFHFLAPFVYGFLLFFLIMLDLLPVAAGSTSRWLQIGSIHIQPSEFMKPVLVLMLARFLSKEYYSPNQLKNLGIVLLLVLTPFALVLKQPDLGTSILFLVVAVPMLYWSGLSGFIIFVMCAPLISFIAAFNFWSFFFAIIIICGILIIYNRGAIAFWTVFLINVAVGLFAPVFWGSLHNYQQQRILTFLGFVSDPHGVGYQIIQSKVAIGSGGLLGKGFLEGTQTQLRFLPAQHTDFIFSVFAEEWGFIGALLILATFFLFFVKCVHVASITKDRFASLTIVGIVTIFSFQVFVNIGMTLGIMPVTGLPLPFISYGGSSLLSSMIMAGLIFNIVVRRYTY